MNQGNSIVRKKAKMDEPPHLPPEIITDILSRLPATSVRRARCVCKSWCSLVDLPGFTEMHLHQSSISPGIVIEEMDGRTGRKLFFLKEVAGDDVHTVTELFEPEELKYLTMVDSSNGLVCFAEYAEAGPMCIYNPATREVVTLPLGTRDCSLNMGFVFDPITKEYKVFRLISNTKQDTLPSQYEVFTMGSNSWRLKDSVPYIGYSNQHIATNGALHFTFGDDGEGLPHSLLSIDISSEDSQVIMFPKLARESGFEPFLVELRGHLSLCIIGTSRIEFWTLRKYNSQEKNEVTTWIKEHSIDLPTGLGIHRLRVCPVPIRNNTMLLIERNYLISFSFLHNTYRRICRASDSTALSNVISHVDSLIQCNYKQ